MCSSDYLFAFPSHHHVVCVFNIRVLFQVASIFISVYDETYSVFGLVRLVFLSEFACRMIKLGIYVFLVVMSLLQFWISRYSDCSNATSIVAMCNAGAFLLLEKGFVNDL